MDIPSKRASSSPKMPCQAGIISTGEYDSECATQLITSFYGVSDCDSTDAGTYDWTSSQSQSVLLSRAASSNHSLNTAMIISYDDYDLRDENDGSMGGSQQLDVLHHALSRDRIGQSSRNLDNSESPSISDFDAQTYDTAHNSHSFVPLIGNQVNNSRLTEGFNVHIASWTDCDSIIMDDSVCVLAPSDAEFDAAPTNLSASITSLISSTVTSDSSLANMEWSLENDKVHCTDRLLDPVATYLSKLDQSTYNIPNDILNASHSKGITEENFMPIEFDP